MALTWRLKVEKRVEAGPVARLASLALALLGALLVSAVLMRSAGAGILESYASLFDGGFGNWNEIVETMVKATPLIFTGLAATIAFRARIWNIGAEGQLFAGAMAAFWVVMNLAGLPRPLLVLAILTASFLGGAVFGLIPGYLKAYLKVDEIIVTVMLNYIVRYALSYLLSGPWKDPASYYLQSSEIPPQAYFPLLVPDSRLHIGFAAALLAAILLYLLLWRTPLGFDIRALGLNPTAARFRGLDVSKTILLVMAISGGVAGLAGAGELAGLQHRLRMDISTGYGFAGIIVAMLGGLQPLWVLLAAVFFGGLVNGSVRMQITTGVPVAVVYVMQAIILLFLLTAGVISRYRLRRVRPC
ncbi:MAG TPA: ABC transporter permease [Anaerolineales bacterium]|nr:ABC transporter permease [Anaerolineales bacterium]